MSEDKHAPNLEEMSRDMIIKGGENYTPPNIGDRVMVAVDREMGPVQMDGTVLDVWSTEKGRMALVAFDPLETVNKTTTEGVVRVFYVRNLRAL